MSYTSGRLDSEAYDLALNGRGFMLADSGDGALMFVQQKVKFSPGGPSPEAEPFTIEPQLETPQLFSVWRNGIGWRDQPDTRDKDANGIYYGRFIDRMGPYLGPSAAVTAFTPATTDSINGGNKLIEFPIAGVNTLIAACGRYLLYRVNDTNWSVAHDFGVGTKITGLAVYRGQQAVAYMYIAYQNSAGVAQPFYTWDGTSATTNIIVNTSAGTPAAVSWLTYRDELWILNQDGFNRWQIQKITDGGNAPTLGGGFVVADGGVVNCKGMGSVDDRMIIRSTIGPLSVNSNENDAQQVSGDTYKTQYKSLNDCEPVTFGQFIILQVAGSLLAYDPAAGTLQEIGMGTLKDNDSGITTGIHTACAPYRLWTVYTWTYNPYNSTAYLWRWGDNDLVDSSYLPTSYRQELPMLYGSLYEQSAQVNGMLVSEIGGTTPRLYWIDAAGVISFMPLSRFSANPYTDPAVTYNITNTSEIYLPAVTARNPMELKSNSGIAVTGANFTAANFWTASYRLAPTGAFSGSTNLQNGGRFSVPVSQRNNWTVSCVSYWMDVKLACTNTSSTAPPLIKSVAIYQTMRPAFKWVYTATVKMGGRVHLRSGGDRGRLYDVADDKSFLESLAGPTGIVELDTPDGDTVQVLVTNFTMELRRREPSERPEWWGIIEMTEHMPINVNGQYQRVAGFGTFTYAYLSNFTYGQLSLF